MFHMQRHKIIQFFSRPETVMSSEAYKVNFPDFVKVKPRYLNQMNFAMHDWI